MRSWVLFFAVIGILLSCQEDNNLEVPQNLQRYVELYSQNALGEVIACAASDAQDHDKSFVFYYPLLGATDIQYYESASLGINPNDYSNYERKELEIEPVFGGKLGRFVRIEAAEAWCVVTFRLQGTLHISNPIRLKNGTKPTEWINTVAIDHTTNLQPTFTWMDGQIVENVIYFQVISDIQNQFLSGTYTTEKSFQYKNDSNVVLHINTETPPTLSTGQEYNFTMMGVSEDNWVNLVIQKTFTAQ